MCEHHGLVRMYLLRLLRIPNHRILPWRGGALSQTILGLSDDIGRGHENIRVNFKVKTDEKTIERLRALSKLSPIFNITGEGTNTDASIEKM